MKITWLANDSLVMNHVTYLARDVSFQNLVYLENHSREFFRCETTKKLRWKFIFVFTVEAKYCYFTDTFLTVLRR